MLLAVGVLFPDALTASAAGARRGHPVRLTGDDVSHPSAGGWLAANTPSTEVCVGGPACRAHPDADTELVGADRYATAVAVADFVDRWDPDEITIFGGTAAIGQDVEDQLATD